MMMNSLVRYGIVFCTFLPIHPAVAGLDLVDSPMFVAEVMAPNVVITPIYSVDYNEAVLKDVPWATKKIFLTTDPAWSKSQFVIGRYYFRVTPWPDVVEYTPGSGLANCRAASVTYACSETSLYAGDIFSSAEYGGVLYNGPMTYSVSGNGGYSPYSFGSTYYPQEAYPQTSPPVVDDRYAEAKSRYFHSDSNFLYFNPSAAPAYQPWPALGGGVYPSEGTEGSAHYSPIRKEGSLERRYEGSLLLNKPVDNLMAKTGGNAVVNFKAYVGQYWVKNTPTSDVTDATSFTGTCWEETNSTGIECSHYMDLETKKNFANWFTYWRSSNLATRGMLGNVFERLHQADLLDKFRYGISINSNTNPATVSSSPIPSVNGFYSVANSVVTDAEIAAVGGDVKSAKKAKLLATVRDIVYSGTTQFSKAWDYRTTNAKLRTLDAYRDVAGAPVRSCRRNYEILVTPDYSHLSYAGVPAYRNVQRIGLSGDNAANVPYQDTYSDMLSDVGAQGWVTDLCKDANDSCGNLANNLLASTRDPATHQHVVRYIIGPNAEGGAIFPKGTLEYDDATDLAKAATTGATWPAKPTGTQNEFAATYDDIWHMALNSHGFFYPSDNVSVATAKLLATFNDVLVRNVSGSAVATNTTSLSGGGKIYKATVENDWKGHLRAYSVTPNQTQAFLEIEYGTVLWDLAEGVSTQADGSGWGTVRKIVTYNGGGVPFRWDDALGATAKSLLKTAVPTGVTDADAYGEKILQYLRGSGECEDGSESSCVSGVPYTFRRRNIDRSQTGPYSAINPNGRNVLGDISNSSPWPVSPPAAGRSDVDFPGYNAFRVAQKSRLNVLYVGANDGMLHAVDASDGDDKGKELFAYIPSFVQANLHELAGAGYAHKFFVDGSPFSADVDLGGWKTVLAGGANKGGKGYYLLDVTDPVKDTETEVADMVKWEFTHPRDLHYTFNLPVADSSGQARQIVRMNDEKLALIVGNGYPELSGKKACLFILYLSGPGADAGDAAGVDYHGAGYHKLCAGAATYATDGGLDTNGLSTPTPVDLDGDGKVDVIYAGDLNGNMWRFNVPTTVVTTTTEVDGSPVTTNEYTNHWAVASSDPVFVAKNAAGVRQPIITPPELALHTVGTTSGPLVLFGTGKYIESSDRANTDVQSFYGVWDRGITAITRNNLFSQTFELDTSLSPNIRKQTTKPTFSYCTAASLVDCPNVIPAVTVPPTLPSGTNRYMGWYWDMPTSGERLTGKMSLINGIILFNTFYPATETYDCDGEESGTTMCTRLDPCQYGGDGWRMGLNAVNGYMEDQFPIFDVNQDGVVDSRDALAAGIKMGAEMGGVTYAKGIGTTYVGIGAATNVSNTGTEKLPTIDVGTAGSGRVSWFELLD